MSYKAFGFKDGHDKFIGPQGPLKSLLGGLIKHAKKDNVAWIVRYRGDEICRIREGSVDVEVGLATEREKRIIAKVCGAKGGVG